MIVKDLKHTLHFILPGLIRRVIDKTQKNIYKFKKIEIEKEEWRGERERERRIHFFGFGNKYGIS